MSVVTPFFNAGDVFEQTARSVKTQSLQSFEWVIVNDGSTDPESLARLQAFRTGDPRIRVIDHTENRGLSAARNTGFHDARARFVFQLDADDLIEPTTLEKCAWFLASRPECAFVKGYTVGFGSQEYLWVKGFHEGRTFLEENRATATAMIRREVHEAVGGYDESIRGGLEDWDFWLRCAAAGFWGATIPEFLDWYRRRERMPGEWSNLECEQAMAEFRARLGTRHPSLAERFPELPRRWDHAFDPVDGEPPLSNSLVSRGHRLLCIFPWLTMGGADKFNLHMIEQLRRRGWEVTIATTLQGDNSWLPEFSRLTPDIFILPGLLRQGHWPGFLRYLIETRGPSAVLISNSELGYQILPYLRGACPRPAFVDYSHMEEEYWKNGGYPRYAVGAQDLLELNIVASDHLRSWMVERGADGRRVEVCHINVDAKRWRVTPEQRGDSRRRLGILEGLPVIVYAVRLCDQKQPRVFAEVVRSLRDRGLRFCALVIGNGPDGPWLNDYIRLHGLEDCVRCVGAVPADRVRDLMAAGDIFFLPSKWEGISLAIYEAMAMELAVVAAAVGGQRELVKPDCGVLIERPEAVEDEVAAYVAALDGLLRDPAKRTGMARAARAFVEQHHSIEAMGDRMEAILLRAIDLHRTDPRPAVSAGFGLECAARGVEYMRISTLADQLWAERDQLRQQVALLGAELQSHFSIAARQAAGDLAELEGSRAWRLVCAVKGTWPYRSLARLRFGPGWDAADPAESPLHRLARLRNSRAYRAILLAKNTRLYRWRLRRSARVAPPAPAGAAAPHLNGSAPKPRPAMPARDGERELVHAE